MFSGGFLSLFYSSVHEEFCGGLSFEEFEPEVSNCLELNEGKWITMVVYVFEFAVGFGCSGLDWRQQST